MRVLVAGAVTERCRALCSARRAGAPGPRRPHRRATASRAFQMASAARLLFGAVARWIAAWLRLSCASGRPTCSSACAAATATSSDGRVGHADVLAGEDDHPAGDEPGVLAGLQHPRQVVHRGLRIAAAHALDERADHVVVVVAAVAQRARAERRLDVLLERPAPGGRARTPPRARSAPGGRRRRRGRRAGRRRRSRRGALRLQAAADQLDDRVATRAARGGTACCGCAAAG